VLAFYDGAAGHRFDEAAALWSPRMQAAYPPAQFINGRFSQTQRIAVDRADVVSSDDAAGRATVAVEVVEVADGATQRWRGTWQVVRGPDGWLLDQPNLAAA
jgi:hypothetical protein